MMFQYYISLMLIESAKLEHALVEILVCAMSEEVERSGALQESWFEVGGGEGAGELVPSSSQEHMEEMLAAAVSEEEQSDTEPLTAASKFQITSQTYSSQQVVGARSDTELPRGLQQDTPPSSRFSGDFLYQLVFPVLVLTHLAMFGLGLYIGRRIALVRSI